ncbi:MAG: sulfite exporter TauE/SafE family protein [Akkermansiaceae bacterium]|nr:sulfite exporter TauE/SafE family protein [Akkermansiaceae bacterium]MCP5548744.1 sulfite exporter TauE/SafE family protein [Akkermansiaceae bacterium]
MTWDYGLALLAALCIGLAKAGFSGISLVSVFLLADLYGAKPSIGLALPLLILADMMAWPAFRKHGSWRPVWRLLGPALVGIGIGYGLLHTMPDHAARKVIGGCILLMVVLQAFKKLHPEVTGRWVEMRCFGFSAGVLGGFATMIANAAGPVIQLYLNARRVPKMELIGIGARFFLLINLLKVPLSANLNLINHDSLLENARLAPGVVLGVFGGRWLIGHVPQAVFEWMIVGFSVVAALRLLVW